MVSATKRERHRCLDILANHRGVLLNKMLHGDLTSRQKVYLRRVILFLGKIEQEISGMEPATEVISSGDFSAEEMERAKEIIAEQQQNPFE